ncbi:MAG: iron-sulfur cluster repair di-iron protein [Phaeodactylibacter sp.]|nr:iron-sulfur cluster repair di-iron protein [Phaeodactylibacter sp.]MCB9272424.1 iron-sulfur cluster repair di-iron protein [Lewinellaceae bacterium]
MTSEKNFQERTVGELVAEDYRAAEVFKKNGIDFCCGGKKTVGEICMQQGLSADSLEAELAQLGDVAAPTRLNFGDWGLAFLSDYIVNVHHSYVLEKIPQIAQYANKVSLAHGHAHPETTAIAHLFEQLAEELITHLEKEEGILFPYIKRLWSVQEGQGKIAPPPFGSAANPIRVMEAEHESAGEAMQEIRRLSGGFTPPDSACNTYRVLYKLLEEFEADLHQHVHLENNILFPKAVALEQSLV